jgi:hypothetical protein
LAAHQRLSRTPPVVPATLPALAQARLGGLLAHQNRIPAAVLEKAVHAQAKSGLRLGTQLVQLGIVSRFDVLRALAAQGGVGFLTAVDSSRLMPAPGRLSAHAVRSLRVVPFEADEGHQLLKVACTAPVPRTAIGALRQLTGWIIEPYLVSDEQWPILARAYGASPEADLPVYAAMPNVHAVAARVAEAARTTGAVHMTEARGDDYLWVRLEGAGRVEDLWLSMGDEAAEDAESLDIPAVSVSAAPATREQGRDEGFDVRSLDTWEPGTPTLAG